MQGAAKTAKTAKKSSVPTSKWKVWQPKDLKSVDKARELPADFKAGPNDVLCVGVSLDHSSFKGENISKLIDDVLGLKSRVVMFQLADEFGIGNALAKENADKKQELDGQVLDKAKKTAILSAKIFVRDLLRFLEKRHNEVAIFISDEHAERINYIDLSQKEPSGGFYRRASLSVKDGSYLNARAQALAQGKTIIFFVSAEVFCNTQDPKNKQLKDAVAKQLIDHKDAFEEVFGKKAKERPGGWEVTQQYVQRELPGIAYFNVFADEQAQTFTDARAQILKGLPIPKILADLIEGFVSDDKPSVFLTYAISSNYKGFNFLTVTAGKANNCRSQHLTYLDLPSELQKRASSSGKVAESKALEDFQGEWRRREVVALPEPVGFQSPLPTPAPSYTTYFSSPSFPPPAPSASPENPNSEQTKCSLYRKLQELSAEGVLPPLDCMLLPASTFAAQGGASCNNVATVANGTMFSSAAASKSKPRDNGIAYSVNDTKQFKSEGKEHKASYRPAASKSPLRATAKPFVPRVSPVKSSSATVEAKTQASAVYRQSNATFFSPAAVEMMRFSFPNHILPKNLIREPQQPYQWLSVDDIRQMLNSNKGKAIQGGVQTFPTVASPRLVRAN
jgi:hypothetical protein